MAKGVGGGQEVVGEGDPGALSTVNLGAVRNKSYGQDNLSKQPSPAIDTNSRRSRYAIGKTSRSLVRPASSGYGLARRSIVWLLLSYPSLMMPALSLTTGGA